MLHGEVALVVHRDYADQVVVVNPGEGQAKRLDGVAIWGLRLMKLTRLSILGGAL